MPYDSTDDPYLDPSSGVLRNVLDITNEELLEWAEANITSVVIAALAEQPVNGYFNLEHLQDIHYELFHTIYDWAGEIRTSEIGKEGIRFANSYVLQQAANGLFDELRKKDLLRGLGRQEYIEELAHYYSEVNILHPFREGNGRTQRVFFDQLVHETGYRFAWERLDANQNVVACRAAYNDDERPLQLLLGSLLESF